MRVATPPTKAVAEPIDAGDVAEFLDLAAARFGDAVALSDASGELTYVELRRRARTTAVRLGGQVGAGDRVALWLSNRVEWVILTLALGLLGAITVPLNTRYRSEELAHTLHTTGARLLIHDPMVLTNDLAAHVRATCLDDTDGVDRSRFPHLEGVVDDAERLCAPGSGDVTPTAAGDRLLVVFFTSGSTGRPRAAAHDHRTLIRHGHHLARQQALGPDDRSLLAVPLAGVYGYVLLFQTLCAGATAVLTSDARPDALRPLLAGSTVANVTDAYLAPFLDAGETEVFAGVHDMFGGIFEREPVGFTAALERLGIAFRHTYGMSEVLAATLLADASAPVEVRAQPGGHAVTPGTESRVVDAQGRPLAPGKVGDLQLRGPVLMRGYLSVEAGSVQLDPAVDADGWFATGDLAELSADGRVVYRGRGRDALRLRGFLVAPAEIEDFLGAQTGVGVAKVVGVEIDGRQEAVAFVEPTPGEWVEPEALFDACRQALANFKVPVAIHTVKVIPRLDGSTGVKIDKAGLTAMAQRLHRDGLPIPEVERSASRT